MLHVLVSLSVVGMALAQTQTGFFNVYVVEEGEHCVIWQDFVSTSQYDAQGYLNNGAVLVVELWGEDTSYDDFLASEVAETEDFDGPLYFYATARGIETRWNDCFPDRVFDEDTSYFDPLDELHVEATVFAGDGSGVIRTLRNPTVKIFVEGYPY